jgi:small-conductance mechanosensitive channel
MPCRMRRKHVLAHVFKVIADPYMGKVGIFRVHQGTVKKDSQLFVGDGKKPFKVAHLYQLQGKDYVEVDELLPGDIGAVAKVEEIEFDCVLHDSHDEDHIHLKPLEFPKPMQGLAVETKQEGRRAAPVRHPAQAGAGRPLLRGRAPPDHARNRDPRPRRNAPALQAGKDGEPVQAGTRHRPPQIPYRETITGAAEGHCRHKKQSGGAGQFGEVYLKIEPLERGAGFEFVDHVKGGVIPGVFMPAVEKGVRQALADGVTAGFPVEDLRVTVYDGKTHAVDGKEVAFVTAGRKATIEAIRAANPIVLEPIVSIEIVSPEAAIGDLTGDLSSRRGHITGTNPRPGNSASITGEVPLAEIADYASRLKSLTGGQGAYTSSSCALRQQVPPTGAAECEPQVATNAGGWMRLPPDRRGQGTFSTTLWSLFGAGLSPHLPISEPFPAMKEHFERFLVWIPDHVAAPARIVLILILASIALRAIHRLLPRLREVIAARQESMEDSQRVRTLSRVVRYALTVATAVVTVLLILGELGISVAPILGAAGVAGIAIGFGAQSLVKDYFTGFFLLLENQIRHGDVVEAGGKAGVVEELTLRYLRLRDYSGNVHFVPNNTISTVTNMSMGFAYAVIDAGVAYGENVDRVIAVMRAVAEAMRQDPSFAPRILEDLEVAGVDQWADSALVIRCRFRVAPLQQWNVRREYLQKLKAAFDREGIEIPYPHLKIVQSPGE